MLTLKYLLMCGGFGMILVAVGILGYDLYEEALFRRALGTPGAAVPAAPKWRWRTSLALVLLAWGPILLAFSIVVVPTGMAGVRVSETSGTVPGTLYPGVHLVTPLMEDVALFDTRDQVFTTGVAEDGKNRRKTLRANRNCSTFRRKRDSTWGWRSRCGTISIPSDWTTYRGTCRIPWRRKLFLRWWRACGAS